MTLDQKRWVIGGLGLLFLLSLVAVQWLEVSRRQQETGDRRAAVSHAGGVAAVRRLPHAGLARASSITGPDRRTPRRASAASTATRPRPRTPTPSATTARRSPRSSRRATARAAIPTEAAEFAASHHSKAGNILASLDNFLAETVEGSRVAVQPAFADARARRVQAVNGMAPANSGCQQCHGSLVAFQATDGGMVTMRDLKPDEAGQPTNLDAVGRIVRNESGKPLLQQQPAGPTPASAASTSTARSARAPPATAGTTSRRGARASRRTAASATSAPTIRRRRSTRSRSTAWRSAICIGEMNLDARPWVLGQDYSAAPTCATCHMSANLRNGMKITHDPGERISWTNRPPVSLVMDTDANHAVVTETDPEKRRAAIADTADAKRNRMKQVCSTCHTPDYINLFYRQYDDLVIHYNEKFAKPARRS